MRQGHLIWSLVLAIVLAGAGDLYLAQQAKIRQLNAEITGLKTQLQQAPIPVREGDTWAVVSSHVDVGEVRFLRFQMVSYRFADRKQWFATLAETGLVPVQNANYLSKYAAESRLVEILDGAADLYRDAPGAWKELPDQISWINIYNGDRLYFRLDRATRHLTDLR